MLVLAIVAATLAVGLWAALSVGQAGPPPERVATGGAAVQCPARGHLARVEIGFDSARGKLDVVACEHFPTGAFECDRSCFRSLVLAPVAFVPTTA
jgi:hypothetical protein